MSEGTMQDKLVNCFVKAQKPLLEAQTAQNAAEFANIQTLLGAILARIEILEKNCNDPGGAKRAPRGERKIGNATAVQTSHDDHLDKVKNAMLFARRMWADNEDFRSKYMTSKVQNEIDADEKTTKHAENTEARRLAEGSLFWRKCASTPQKTEIRDEFNRWKQNRERLALEAPLGADKGDNKNDDLDDAVDVKEEDA